ncbi:hypothetical protein CWR43_07485 [Rhizobium sullae]|uniref:AEC family transporter n=2 Tax=Rhizobium sullae TaxID=50338 RepID=A0A2N0DDG1_RHISU|nr:hypothetical protein CWR43_07485 [Rhizobium sullae]
MHMLSVIIGGIVLLGVFALFGKLWGGDISGVAAAMKAFIPVWLMIAIINQWVGVTRADYTVFQELPILVVVFSVPAVIAAVVAWHVVKA